MRFTLSARPPFSLPAVVRSHGWIQLAPFARHADSTGFSYTSQLDSGKVVEIDITEAEAGVVVQAGPTEVVLDPEELDELTRKVTWMLGLDQEFDAFYAMAQDEPRLAHVVSSARGRILRSATLFEDVVKTILTTNTLWAATIRMSRNLVEQFGPSSAGGLTAFPHPLQLAEAGEEALRSVGRLGYRAPYVFDLARRVSAEELDLESLKSAKIPTPELRKRLLELKGIGAYAAANLLMLLGRYDFIPVDSWAVKMVSHEWYGGEPVSPAQVDAAFERWGEWKGLAYWLWDWSYKG